jgi:hypothetical protein
VAQEKEGGNAARRLGAGERAAACWPVDGREKEMREDGENARQFRGFGLGFEMGGCSWLEYWLVLGSISNSEFCGIQTASIRRWQFQFQIPSLNIYIQT